jgi:SDR family mycofactocin-dependent oxidoreductase
MEVEVAGRVNGKVAFITGAARGQGRSHAVMLAEEGADIIAVDLGHDIDTVGYPLATDDDLAQTAKLVEALDRRIVTVRADVREPGQLREAVARGLAELGRLDIVVANAGIAPLGADLPPQAFIDAVDVNLVGVINTISAAFPHLTSGASIIAIGSVAALIDHGGTANPTTGPGGAGYTHSKRAIARFVHDLANQLAPHSIRVNAVHPTNCNTDMLQSKPMYRIFRPDVADPGREDAEIAFPSTNRMPVGYVEAEDISNAVVFLASDESRYVTGLQMKVDAGALLPKSTSGAPA